MVRIASATGVPWATSTSTWRSLATLSSGLCLFLDMDPSSFGSEAILQGGPLQRGRINGAPFFQPCPEVLDAVAIDVDPVWTGNRRIRPLRRDRGPGAQVPDALTEGIGGEAAVPHDPARSIGQAVEQTRRHRQLVRRPGRERKGDGPSTAIGDHASLSRKPFTQAFHAS